jgi:hypothetical protein
MAVAEGRARAPALFVAGAAAAAAGGGHDERGQREVMPVGHTIITTTAFVGGRHFPF